jgi:DNA-binding CsgD family transcriptional regulator
MPAFLYVNHLIELLELALTLDGTIEERIMTLLDYVRVHVLDDCEAIFTSKDHFDFEARRLLLGQLTGSVRADIDTSIYGVLRNRYFLERIDQSFPAWAASIVREDEKSSTFWMCDTLAAGGVDVAQWREEQLHPAGLEDVWGATAYVGEGSFLKVLVPLHCGGQRPTPEQVQFILKLPPVLAPILMSNKPLAPKRGPKEGVKDGLSEAQSRVLHLALNGLTEKDIAHRLHRSHHTVNSHLRTIYRHYNVSSRAELLALALEHDLKGR